MHPSILVMDIISMTTCIWVRYNRHGYQIKEAARRRSVCRGRRHQQAVEQRGKRLLAVRVQPAIEKAGVGGAHHRTGRLQQRSAGGREVKSVGPRIIRMQTALNVTSSFQKSQDLPE